jgi:hypothetical protein
MDREESTAMSGNRLITSRSVPEVVVPGIVRA